MATITRKVGGDGDAQRGYVEFQIDYDDRKNYLTALRCINSSTEAAWGQATLVADGRSYDMRFPAGQTTYIAIPTGAAQRLGITVDPRGRIDGVEYHFMWPYP